MVRPRLPPPDTGTSGGSDPWQRLLFRDYLRSHPEEADRYVALKRDLAARHAMDREAYTEGKSAFVEEILRLCSGWREPPDGRLHQPKREQSFASRAPRYRAVARSEG